MKGISLLILSAVLVASVGIAAIFVMNPPQSEDVFTDREVIYQVSTINALLEGLYDGMVPFSEVKQHGDFGIGCADRLGGEMIAVDGTCYIVPMNGSAYIVSDATTTPFTTVTFFDVDAMFPIDSGLNYSETKDLITGELPSRNLFYAIRMDGRFSYMKTRSIPEQHKPYPKLVEVVEHQNIFEFHDVNGTAVGLWSPAFVSGLNIPGYHLHFLTSDRTAGGHVLDFVVGEAVVQLDTTSRFMMVLPEEGEFSTLNLSGSQEDDLNRVER